MSEHIGDAAVEAAVEAVVEAMIEYGPDGHTDGSEIIARAALEAAGPAIRADIAAEMLGPIEFIAAICEAREMLAPGDRDIQTIKGIADAVLSTAKAGE